MLETLITYLNTLLDDTGFFQKQFSLCETIYRGDGEFYPAQYCGGGNFTPINNFSQFNGVAYWKKNGNVSISEDESSFGSLKPCDFVMNFSIPLKLVCMIPKKKANEDNNFTDDEIAMKIISAVTTDASVLKSQLNAMRAFVFPGGYETDNSTILKAEYSTPAKSDMNYNFSYLSIDFTASILIRQTCIIDPCS